jgi:hydroxyacylglutathione hydrolase
VLSSKQLASESGAGIVIDARDPEAFAAGHIPRSYSVWAAGLPVFGGWIAGPSTPVFLVLAEMDDLEDAVLSLARIGVDNVAGVLAGGFDEWRDAGMPIERSGAVAPRDLELGKVRVLDVREDSEFEGEGHIPDASHLYVGYLEQNLRKIIPRLDKGERVAVACSVGHRASLAVSILLRHGFDRVDNLLGGMTAWNALELPREKGKETTVTTPEIEGERT